MEILTYVPQIFNIETEVEDIIRTTRTRMSLTWIIGLDVKIYLCCVRSAQPPLSVLDYCAAQAGTVADGINRLPYPVTIRSLKSLFVVVVANLFANF